MAIDFIDFFVDLADVKVKLSAVRSKAAAKKRARDNGTLRLSKNIYLH